MSQTIGLIAICLTVCVCVSSCSFFASETTRYYVEAKTTCFQAGGEWDTWASACGKSE